MEKAIAVAGRGAGSIYRSIWMRSIPTRRRASVRPFAEDSRYREAQLAMEMLAASGKLRSLESPR